MAFSSSNNQLFSNHHQGQIMANNVPRNSGAYHYNFPEDQRAREVSRLNEITQSNTTQYDISSLDPGIVYRVLSSANEQALLGSGNVAYRELYNSNIRLETELKLEKNRRPEQMSMSVTPSMPLAPPPSSASLLASSVTTSNGLVIPPSPPLLDRDDYPNADECWWNKQLWIDHVQREKSKGCQQGSKMDFLTDASGKPVGKNRIAIFSKAARALWVTLYQCREDPENWGTAKSKDATDYFSNSMRIQFPEFQLCEGDWKVEAFAIIRYPDWKGSRDVDTLKRNKPSIHSGLKRKNPPTNQEAKVKKAKKTSPAAATIDVDAIDPEPDVPVVSNDSSRALTFPPPPPPSTSALDPTVPTTSSLISTPVQNPPPPPPSTPARALAGVAPQPPPSTPSLSDPTRQETQDRHSLLPPSPHKTNNIETGGSEGASPTPKSSAQTSVQPDLTPPEPEPSPAQPNPPEPPAAQLDQPTTQPPEQPHGETENGTIRKGRPRRQGVNILQTLSIPKPAATVTAPVTTSAPTGPTTGSTQSVSKARGKKGDTLLKDNGTTSPRNLYAIDYLAKNGETSAEDFKQIWDNLPAEIIKEYKLKSVAAKKKN